jgi:hypothetical protein
VKDFADANHAPVITLDGPLDRTVRVGETVKLATSATDPDGDKLSFKWWRYDDADSATAPIEIAHADTADRASFVVPR